MTDIELSAERVASYLRRNPSFLSDFPDLALAMVIPRHAGAATSLTSYQLDVLREKNGALAQRLRELSEVAQDNEALIGRVHQLSLRLLRARRFADTVLAVAASLREDFHTDLVRVCLIGAPVLDIHEPWLLQIGADAQPLGQFADFRGKGEPLCGRLRQEKLDFLFGDLAGEVSSAVLLPVGQFGFLGIGSADPNRFHPGMGTVFLRQIAELIDTALASAA